jgi:hypothetical protein
MTVAHDAYPFDAEGFAAEAQALLDADHPAGLRDAALAAYHDSADVRALADRYGGWDHDTLAIELDDDPPFWLVLILYRHLDTDATYGLGSAWLDLAGEQALGLPAPDAELLVRGRPLSELDPRFADVHPVSTAGHAGWLAAEDAQRCARVLTSTADGEGSASLRAALREMLDHAPLCVIVSG